MLFSVIYSFDCPRNVSVNRFMPSQRKLFTQTEGDSCYEYDYLAEGDEKNPWFNGKHRKLCAILTRKQFEQFLSDTGLVSEDVETMGSLGAPGFGLGWAPAISFNGDSLYESVIQNAYVTPIPMAKKVKDLETYDYELTERDWQRVRDVIVKKYQYGV